jgi:hypothetical protein
MRIKSSPEHLFAESEAVLPFEIWLCYTQDAAERTPRFGRGVARGEVGVEQWGACG